jgi:hypothetical protein
MMVNGIPQPTRIRFSRNITPHLLIAQILARYAFPPTKLIESPPQPARASVALTPASSLAVTEIPFF